MRIFINQNSVVFSEGRLNQHISDVHIFDAKEENIKSPQPFHTDVNFIPF